MIRAALPIALLALLCLASLMLGARSGIDLADLAALFAAPDPSNAEAIVVRELRLPRTLGAVIAGGALGMAGALIQTLTRNPLTDPGLLGVNAGAALGIVTTVWIAGPLAQSALITPALAGAFAALGIVWTIGASSRSPLTLILAGTALTALLSAILRGMILSDRATLDVYRDWLVGVLDRADVTTVAIGFTLAAIGTAFAIPASRRLDTLALGSDLASALGTNLVAARFLTLAAIGILATAAVLVSGPLLFVGLVAPHLARAQGLQTTPALMVGSGAIGAILLLIADFAGRIIAPGLVIEAGLGVTLIGGVFLIWIVRREGRNPA